MAKKTFVMPALPEGYQSKDGLAWGSRAEGLLEIAYFAPQKKNAVIGATQMLMAKLVNEA